MASEAKISFRRPKIGSRGQNPTLASRKQKICSRPDLASEAQIGFRARGQNLLQRPLFQKAQNGPKLAAEDPKKASEDPKLASEGPKQDLRSFKELQSAEMFNFLLNLLALRRHKAQKPSLFDLLKHPRLRSHKATDDNSTKSCAGAQGRSP